MTEQFVKCSRCACKYHNNEENIKQDFGFKRLGERYKLCVKCRDKHAGYNYEWRQTGKGQALHVTEIACQNCGEPTTRNKLHGHKQSWKCRSHGMDPKPNTCVEWLLRLRPEEVDSLPDLYKSLCDKHKNAPP